MGKFHHCSSHICSAPIQIALAIYFLWMELGPPVLAGLGVMIFMIPINFLISTKMRSLQVNMFKQFYATAPHVVGTSNATQGRTHQNNERSAEWHEGAEVLRVGATHGGAHWRDTRERGRHFEEDRLSQCW